jgi:hypothetical protein
MPGAVALDTPVGLSVGEKWSALIVSPSAASATASLSRFATRARSLASRQVIWKRPSASRMRDSAMRAVRL